MQLLVEKLGEQGIVALMPRLQRQNRVAVRDRLGVDDGPRA